MSNKPDFHARNLFKILQSREGKSPNPEIYVKTKRGKIVVNPEYNAYLRSLIGMDCEERREWGLLGVHLTREREGKIVGFRDAKEFILAPIGENGNGNGENA